MQGNGLGRALVGTLWLSLSGYVTYVLGFAANLLLARLLLPRDFGEFALALSAVELLFILSGFSFSQGIIQLGADPDVIDTAFTMTLWASAVLLVLAGAVSVALRVLYHPAFATLFLALAAIRAVAFVSNVYSAPLERELQYALLSRIRLAATLIATAAMLAAAALGARVWSLVAREALIAVATFAGLIVFTDWTPAGRYSRDTARLLWVFGYRIFLGRALELVWYRSGTFLLGVLGGVETLGLYDRARYLAEIGHQAVSAGAVQVALPVYARLRDDVDRLTDAYRLIHYFLIRLMFPVLIGIALYPYEIVHILYGSRWLDAAPILRWLALYAFLFPILDNIKVLLTGANRLMEAVWVRVAQAAVSLGLLLVVIPKYGAVGVAGALTVGSLVSLAVGYRYLATTVRDRALSLYVRPAIAALITGAVIEAGRHMHLLHGAGRPVQAAYIAASAVFYGILLFMMDRAEIRANVGLLVAGFRGGQQAAA